MTAARALLYGLVLTVFSFPAAAKDWSAIRIGVSGNYPPFNSVDENNRFHGFEVDLANALCLRMRARCEFVRQQWEDLIPALIANQFDTIMASMSITEERRQRVSFTKRYYQTPAAFIAKRDANLRDVSAAAMKGRVIGVQAGTIHHSYAEAVYASAGATIRAYATQQEAQFDLARGRLDAVLADKLGVYGWLNKTDQGKCCSYAGGDLLDPAYVGEGVGFAVRKEDQDLRERLDSAIDALLADGTYKQINDKYFPFSIY